MKFSKKLIVFCWIVSAGLNASQSLGQCVPSVSKVIAAGSFSSTSAASVWTSATNLFSSGSVCITPCTTGTCTEYVVGFDRSTCSFAAAPTISIPTPLGKVELVGASFTNANLPGIVFQKFRSITSTLANGWTLCKGRITFNLTTPTVASLPLECQDCLSPYGQVTYTTSFDASKTIASYDAIVGPSCVNVGERAAYTVNPRLQCPADGIGIDPIVWTYTDMITANATVAYQSGDQTAITFEAIPTTFAPPGDGANVFAKIGKCPSGGLQLTAVKVNKGPAFPYIQSTSIFNLNGYSSVTMNAVPNGSAACPSGSTTSVNGTNENGIILPINTSPTLQQNINLNVNGNGAADQGLVYTFSPASNAESGFTWTQGSSTNPNQNPGFSLTTTQFSGGGGINNNATIAFSANVTAAQGGCGSTGANYRVFRYLVKPTSTPPLTQANSSNRFNYVINNNAATADNGNVAGATLTCFKPGDSEVITLQNAPTGPLANFRWEVPSGWIITNMNGTVATNVGGVLKGSNITSVRISPGTSPVAGKVKVSMALPTFFVNGVEWCGVPSGENLIEYPYNSNLIPATTTVTISGTPTTFAFTAGAPTGSGGNTSSNITVSPNTLFSTCSGPAFDIQYQFSGKVYASATDRDFNSGAGQNPVYETPGLPGAVFECNSSIFPATAYCPNTSNNDLNSSWQNLTGNSLNIAFRSGRYYKGFYRFRIKTTSTTANQCSPFTCFYSGWVQYPSSGGAQNWRMAVDGASWDGGSEIGEPVSTLTLYPNPADKAFTLQVPDGETGTYEVTTLTGKTILQGRLEENSKTLDVHTFPTGIYIVKFVGKGQYTQKLVIE